MPGDRLDTLKARKLAAGLTTPRLAFLSNTSDWIIHQLENGGTCQDYITARILAALAPVSTIATSSVANPTVITTTAPHGLVTGDTVVIAGHTGSTPAVDGTRVVTVTGATTFTVPVNVSSGGTGGTVTLNSASIGRVPVA